MPLTVDTAVAVDDARFSYKLTQSPPPTTVDLTDVEQQSHPALPPPPKPSLRLLFSFISQRDALFLLFPAVATSVLAGGVAPFMTHVVGQAFDVFAQFPITPNPPQSAKDALLHGVGMSAIELLSLAIGALALSSVTSSLWIWTGERNVKNLRIHVYDSITNMDMEWFDTKMGADDTVVSEGDGPLGAGGLMAKFAKETDDVRMASSLTTGMLIQYMTTTLTCLALAFQRSWSLTLVILSAVPVLMFIQGLSQGFAGPLLAVERAQTSIAATLVDRATSAIATVKAFNAASHERITLSRVLERMLIAARGCNTVWALTSGLAQFVMMAMFVQGFWFGGKLVRDGSVSAGDVMAVFWACLIATSNLQMCIPQFIILAKGKFSMVALLTLVNHPHSRQPIPVSSNSNKGTISLRKIVPSRCAGELALHAVTFAYPSRPTVPVLSDVSLFLPSRETTFIVGGSGSGKSTVAALLLRMYDPQHGSIEFDEQDLAFLDPRWASEHIACISQGAILFDMTVHENVAMGLAGSAGGRRPQDVTREEVIEACRVALMHEFIRDLPEGYDTRLGTGGANLSGGQKQRLAIARAKLRNPTVLILDEATSALDVTSRLLVFEAIKHFRRDKTTIVITHDLSQIGPGDFVYVLKNGEVVEQGFRLDLEQIDDGEFRAMRDAQGETGGFLPEKDDPAPLAVVQEKEKKVEAILEHLEDEKHEEMEEMGVSETPRPPFSFRKHQSLIPAATLRPTTLGNWMFEAVTDLTRSTAPTPTLMKRASAFIPPEAFGNGPHAFDDDEVIRRPRRPSSIQIPSIAIPPTALHPLSPRRLSLQFTPTSPTLAGTSMASLLAQDDTDFEDEKRTLERSGTEASRRRLQKRMRTRWDEKRLAELTAIKVEKDSEVQEPEVHASDREEQMSFSRLVRAVYPTVPQKPYILLGLIICLLSGAMTPLFSFLLSRLLFQVSVGADDVSAINKYGGIVLGVAAADGLCIGLKYLIMETAAMTWVTKIRNECFERVLAQDKKWFDKTENSPVRLVQVLIKDGDDARSLIATVLCQSVVVMAMLSVGLIWALVIGWQLTLVGLAIAPVFAATMVIQTNLVSRFELRNKRAREEVAKDYYDTISNVRGIRAMAFDSVFREKFNNSVRGALSTGVQGAFVEGCTYGVASALIYLAEALLFYVGATLIARGTYTYLQMVEVLNLCVFTVTIGSQLMAFTQRIAKSTMASRDFHKLLSLSMDSNESHGSLKPTVSGNVMFSGVSFSYPERSDVPVLKDVSIELFDNECVAIVGASGSGKSTIAALLQRLYEPDSGTITIGATELRFTDVAHLRDHVSVVSQNPHLFDATIAENIAYGTTGLSDMDIQRAARAANVHDFIMSLPSQYETMVGENASLISGGQAQRLQIARALARPSNILILDECTSALDAANQAAVMETIRLAKVGRTTLMVTHKLPVMRMCDRILVLDQGHVAEEGTYEMLMEQNGVFATLASGGEWAGE